MAIYIVVNIHMHIGCLREVDSLTDHYAKDALMPNDSVFTDTI
jgi:hypothetical protein